MDLRGVNLENSIDGGLIHPKLSKIKWITMFYPENPQEEVTSIKLALKILREDKEKKMLITDYQFILKQSHSNNQKAHFFHLDNHDNHTKTL